MSDDDALELYWDDIRIARHRAPTPTDAVNDIRAQLDKGDLVIGTSRERVLAVIKVSGEVVFGPEYKPDEAASVFWEAVGRHRHPYEDQILVIQHMESVLTRVGVLDMRLHELHLALQAGHADARDQIGGAQVALERAVGQAIELGRGLARRPEIPHPTVPERIPERIRLNPDNQYVGAPALADGEGVAEGDPQDHE